MSDNGVNIGANDSIDQTDDLIDLLMVGAKSYRCGIYLHNLDSLQRHQIYQELEIERLDNKYSRIRDLHIHSIANWNQIFLFCFMDSLSDMDNRKCYNELSQLVHFSMIQRERRSLRNIEALLIGVSGLIDTLPRDSFSEGFKKEAEYMLHKYQIKPLDKGEWNLKKITPIKHPIVRLSQVAHLFYENEHPFNRVVSCANRNDILSLFNVEASVELCQRVNLKAKGASHIGVTKSDLLGINFVVPLLYAYGLYTGDDSITDRAGEINEMLPAESNFYITAWRKKGLTPQSAYETQALIQLSKCYCAQHRCHECHIFQHMISPYSILHKVPIILEHQK